MTEWLKVRAWKVRIPQKGIVGSNPAFSANGENETCEAGFPVKETVVKNLFL